MLQTDQLNAFGTPSAPKTLTDTYQTWNTALDMFRRLHLDIDYTPLLGQTNRFISIRIRYSSDGGVTWRERTLKTNSTTETKLYQAVPLIFPGSKVSVGGDLLQGVFDEDGAVSDLVEIGVKESGSGNHGTAFIGVVLEDNLSQ